MPFSSLTPWISCSWLKKTLQRGTSAQPHIAPIKDSIGTDSELWTCSWQQCPKHVPFWMYEQHHLLSRLPSQLTTALVLSLRLSMLSISLPIPKSSVTVSMKINSCVSEMSMLYDWKGGLLPRFVMCNFSCSNLQCVASQCPSTSLCLWMLLFVKDIQGRPLSPSSTAQTLHHGLRFILRAYYIKKFCELQHSLPVLQLPYFSQDLWRLSVEQTSLVETLRLRFSCMNDQA